MMKLFFRILTCACLTLTLCCCNTGQNETTQLLEKLHHEDALPLLNCNDYDTAVYENGLIAFTYTIGEDVDFNLLHQRTEELNDYVVSSIEIYADSPYGALFKKMVDEKINMKVYFRNSKGLLGIYISSEELAYHLNNDDAEHLLKTDLKSIELLLPINMGNGLVCQRVELDDEYFTFYVHCDEDLVDLREFQQSMDENHDGMVELITTTNNTIFTRILTELKHTNRGLRYLYTGASGKEAMMTINNNEL